MTWLRKMRPALVAVALMLGIGSLIGARALTNGHSDAGAKGTDAAPRSAGLYVLGTVDTDPPPVSYGLPPVLQTGTIAKVHVKDGDEVKADQPLYEFDATMQKQDVKRAEAAVEYAKMKVKEAEELAKKHAKEVEGAEKGVELADRKAKLRADQHNLIKSGLETAYRLNKIPMEEWEGRLASEPTLFAARVDYDTAVGEKDIAKLKVDHLKAIDPQVKVKEAEAAVEQAKAELSKAQAAVDLCVVKAKAAGTVEQVTIGPGTTLGISTRTPALWLIPSGPRVVRAEVEADFAHRVGNDRIGREVTISDHTDPKLTYTGTVRRVGTTFLLKRGTAESLVGNDTRVIEAVIEVADPAPAGKPPLRVGQRVRVNLGQ